MNSDVCGQADDTNKEKKSLIFEVLCSKTGIRSNTEDKITETLWIYKKKRLVNKKQQKNYGLTQITQKQRLEYKFVNKSW